MPKEINFTWDSVSSIDNAIREMRTYQDEVVRKCEMFAKRLADVGIETAKLNLGGYGKYITFSTTTNLTSYGCKAVLLATNTGMIKSEWRTSDGVKTADVSPLLMAEFGSGLRAKNPKGVAGVGTGTFPNQTHATDPSGWWYMDLQGDWHHSYGIRPTMPMFRASVDMNAEIVGIAKEVFNQ